MRPDGPARDLGGDLDPSPALVRAVVPLTQVVDDLDPVAESGPAARIQGSPKGARDHPAERPFAERLAEPGGLLAAAAGQRDVRSAGMTTRPRPLGLAMADDDEAGPDLAGGRRAGTGRAGCVGHASSSPAGRASASGSAAKNARGRQPNRDARRFAGTWPMRVSYRYTWSL